MKKSKLIQTLKEEISKILKEGTKTLPDVANLAKAQSTASGVSARAKNINTPQEFEGAFQVWFQTLGFEPGKISKGVVRSSVDKVLGSLGYK